MLNFVQINLHYEEWAIRLDSPPGWEIVVHFVRNLIEMPLPFRSWIFERDPKTDYYVNIRTFGHEDRHEYLNALREFMRKDAICMIKSVQNAPFEQLLKNFSKVSKGVLKNNQKSQVFPAPIESGDWITIGEEEILLAIYHDGDPLFFFKKEKK